MTRRDDRRDDKSGNLRRGERVNIRRKDARVVSHCQWSLPMALPTRLCGRTFPRMILYYTLARHFSAQHPLRREAAVTKRVEEDSCDRMGHASLPLVPEL